MHSSNEPPRPRSFGRDSPTGARKAAIGWAEKSETIASNSTQSLDGVADEDSAGAMMRRIIGRDFAVINPSRASTGGGNAARILGDSILHHQNRRVSESALPRRRASGPAS